VSEIHDELSRKERELHQLKLEKKTIHSRLEKEKQNSQKSIQVREGDNSAKIVSLIYAYDVIFALVMVYTLHKLSVHFCLLVTCGQFQTFVERFLFALNALLLLILETLL